MIDLNSITLAFGSHDHRDDGVCLLEAVSWFAGEPHTDRPSCVDRALAAYGRALNDALEDDERQLLRPLVPLLVGTAGTPKLSMRRALHLVDRHVRYVLPEFMRALPGRRVKQVAGQFAALDPITDGASALHAYIVARDLRDLLFSDAEAARRTRTSAASYDTADVADAIGAYDAAGYVACATHTARTVDAAYAVDAAAYTVDAAHAAHAAHASSGTVAYADVTAARAGTDVANAARDALISRMIEVYRAAIAMR